mmetsp:Transcript_14420/g.50677  ORF Transcript_14420/g.50677 Transcript_14420/m.50677 type:complete len:289 (+) Transcript_14420:393-1259(+)
MSFERDNNISASAVVVQADEADVAGAPEDILVEGEPQRRLASGVEAVGNTLHPRQVGGLGRQQHRRRRVEARVDVQLAVQNSLVGHPIVHQQRVRVPPRAVVRGAVGVELRVVGEALQHDGGHERHVGGPRGAPRRQLHGRGRVLPAVDDGANRGAGLAELHGERELALAALPRFDDGERRRRRVPGRGRTVRRLHLQLSGDVGFGQLRVLGEAVHVVLAAREEARERDEGLAVAKLEAVVHLRRSPACPRQRRRSDALDAGRGVEGARRGAIHVGHPKDLAGDGSNS